MPSQRELYGTRCPYCDSRRCRGECEPPLPDFDDLLVGTGPLPDGEEFARTQAELGAAVGHQLCGVGPSDRCPREGRCPMTPVDIDTTAQSSESMREAARAWWA